MHIDYTHKSRHSKFSNENVWKNNENIDELTSKFKKVQLNAKLLDDNQLNDTNFWSLGR